MPARLTRAAFIELRRTLSLPYSSTNRLPHSAEHAGPSGESHRTASSWFASAALTSASIRDSPVLCPYHTTHSQSHTIHIATVGPSLAILPQSPCRAAVTRGSLSFEPMQPMASAARQRHKGNPVAESCHSARCNPKSNGQPSSGEALLLPRLSCSEAACATLSTSKSHSTASHSNANCLRVRQRVP